HPAPPLGPAGGDRCRRRLPGLAPRRLRHRTGAGRRRRLPHGVRDPMADTRVRKEEILEVHPEVAAIVADALGRDVEEAALDRRLIEDLGAESIDFLDIVYRLERAFRVK